MGEKDGYGGFSRYGAVRRLFNALARRAALAGLLVAAALSVSPDRIAAAEPVRLLALGDSLTAGYGLAPQEGFVSRLEAALRERGHDVEVLDGGVSGDTSAGGLSRLDWALADDPDLVLVELGANDGLRGIDPASTRGNLDAILSRLKERGIPVLLAGMYAPPNLGPDFGRSFNAIYPELAEKHDVPLYPFFLDGVAAVPALNQPDGIHPNAEGVGVVVERILPHLEPLIRSAAG